MVEVVTVIQCLTDREWGFNQLQLGILSTWGDILSRLALAHDLIVELPSGELT